MSSELMATEPATVDAVAGLASDSPVAALRRQRPEIVRLTELSEQAALRPKNEGNLDRHVRAALACRIARLLKDNALVAHYTAALETSHKRLAGIANGASPGENDMRLAAIVRHADLVTQNPGRATQDDIQALRDAGLTEADIVTLSGVIAFVNYQARVVAGLRMLKGE